MAKAKRQQSANLNTANSDAAEGVVANADQHLGEQVSETDQQLPVVEEVVTEADPVEEVPTTKPVEVTVDPHEHVISTGAVTFTANSDAAEGITVSNVVEIRIEYPASYHGNRRLKSGKVYQVSPETAEILIAKGIAKLIEK